MSAWPPADPRATTEMRAFSLIELLAATRADELRSELDLAPGHSALLLTRGPGAGSRLSLDEDVVTLGRSPGATVLLDDVSVSRRHAEIRPADGGYRIVDAGSLNGTYLNGSRVEEADLVHGDDIQVGRFRFCFLSKPLAPRPSR